MRQLSRLALDLRARGRQRSIRGRQLSSQRLRAALLRRQRRRRRVELCPLRAGGSLGGAALLLQRRVLRRQLLVAGGAQLAQLGVFRVERGGGGGGGARRVLSRGVRLGARRRKRRLRRLCVCSQLLGGCEARGVSRRAGQVSR